MHAQPETVEGQRFLEQNDAALTGLTAEDVETVDFYAEHHAGGLYVVGGRMPDGRYVKAHDTWGDPDDGEVVVNAYDPDSDRDEWGDNIADTTGDAVEYFDTMHDALARFRALVEDVPDLPPNAGPPEK